MGKLKDRWPELCKLVENDDGLPTRPSGPWAADKLYFWNRYIDITTRAMVDNPKWPAGLVYVDLFSGPGICQISEKGTVVGRIPGSPLIAANAPKPFRKLIFCEKDLVLSSALSQRLRKSRAAATCCVLTGDCNKVIEEVTKLIPPRALVLAFIDPTGLHARFGTIKKLATGRSVDLLILIPDNMDIVRNVDTYAKQSNSKLDTFLGAGSNWRERYRSLPNHSWENICELFSEIYKSQLATKFGYKVFGTKTMKKSAHAPLYKILFASKNRLGLRFWDKITQKDRGGQRELF